MTLTTPTNKQSKAAEKKAEYDKVIDELARQTLSWAMENGCYRDKESGAILGYFVVSQPNKKTPKPIWTSAFGEDIEVWYDVLDKMISLGYPIAAAPMQGHYIGFAGEQAVKAATQINNAHTRLETARKQLRLIAIAGDIEDGRGYLEKRLKSELKTVDIRIFLSALDEFFLAIGQSVQTHLADLFLRAEND